MNKIILPSFERLESRTVPSTTVYRADFNDDGIADQMEVSNPGIEPRIEVTDGATGKIVLSFLAYSSSFTGGVSVAIGDVNGDGRMDIITGAGYGGGPHVRAFSGVDGSQLFNAFAYDSNFRGGVFVSSGDFDGDGRDDIVTGAGIDGGPHVRCFNLEGEQLGNVMIGDPESRKGVRVGCMPHDETGPALLTSTLGNTSADSYQGFTGQLLEFDSIAVDPIAWNLPSDATHRDIVSVWNDATLRAIRSEETAPPRAARALAIVHTAIFDAVNAIENRYAPYLVQETAPVGASTQAAAIEAGFQSLIALFPTQTDRFQIIRDAQIAALTDTGIADGITVGAKAANTILAIRATDQPAANPYVPGTEPGQWRPTPTANAAFALPDWGRVAPFTMTSNDQFRPEAPPPMTSQGYTSAFDEVKRLGSVNSTDRTSDQTEIALFWAANAGTDTPPGMTNRIIENIVSRRNLPLLESARTFALVNVALADAGIVAWDAKRLYNWWRPITAIREADTDGNPDTVSDPNWVPLLNTPNHPDYVSGHSTFSSAGAAVLTSLFGNNVKVTAWAADIPNVSRTFVNFEAAAEEAGQSRIFGGIHTQYANQAGLESGIALGQYVAAHFMKPLK